MKYKEKTKKKPIEQYSDITDYKKTEGSEREYISEMKFLADTAMDFVEFPPEKDIFQYIGGKDPTKMVYKIGGLEISGQKSKVSVKEGKAILLSGKLTKWPGGFTEMSSRYITKSASQVVKKLFNLNEVYMIGLSRKGEILGEVVILLRRQNEIKYPDFIETFIKQAAIALQQKKAEEALRQSRQEFISIFRDNPEAAVYVDEKGNILDINLRFIELFGYSLKEIKGKNINSGIIHPPDKIEEGKDIDSKTLSKGYINFETIRKKKDGTLFPVSISGSPVIVDGKPRGIIGMILDITERKKTEEQLKESFKIRANKMRTVMIFFLIMILAVSLFGVDIVLAGNDELTELEAQQLKILKLSKVVEEHPSTIELKEDLENYKMGLEFYQHTDYQQAISELLKVEYSTLNLPLYIKSQYLLGDCYRKIEDWNRAIEIYKNLVRDDPILTDYSLFHLAETYRLKGENHEYTATYKQITENFPQSLIISEVNYQIAQNYRELNDTTSAVIYYKAVSYTHL